MPNKTIYLRDGEEATWDRAKRIAELTQSNVSTVIMKALREYVNANDVTARRIEEAIKEATNGS